MSSSGWITYFKVEHLSLNLVLVLDKGVVGLIARVGCVKVHGRFSWITGLGGFV